MYYQIKFSVLFFETRVSCRPVWPQILHVAKDDCELWILRFPPPKCQDNRYVPLCPAPDFVDDLIKLLDAMREK